jgi:hypothetical protein
MEITNDCDDWQWEDDLDYLGEILKKTRIKNGFLQGRNMGWRRMSGATDVFGVSANNIISKFGDFSWRVVVNKEGHQLSFVRYSHDEPTGATILLHSSRHYNRIVKESR